MYAGIPFKKEGNVQITATAVGENATDTQTVELVIGQEIEEAINDNSNQITGGFTDALGNLSNSGTLSRILLAVLLTAAIVAFILLKE
jgi:hypothetical protein